MGGRGSSTRCVRNISAYKDFFDGSRKRNEETDVIRALGDVLEGDSANFRRKLRNKLAADPLFHVQAGPIVDQLSSIID